MGVGFAFLALAMLALYASFGSLQSLLNSAALHPLPMTRDRALGPAFLAYRDAVSNYAQANPSFRGSVARSQLTLPPGLPVLPGEGAQVVSLSQTTSGVVAYAAIPASAIAEAERESGWDATLGVVTSSGWTSSLGPQGALPVSVPVGDGVSSLQMSLGG